MKKTILMLTVLILLAASAVMPVAGAVADEVNAFATLVADIQLDKAMPNVDYLQAAKPLNKGELRYVGGYRNWQIHVTVKEKTGLINDFGFSRQGSDIIDELLPFAVAVYGKNYQAREKSPRDRGYGWGLDKFKTVNLFYQSGYVRFGGGYL